MNTEAIKNIYTQNFGIRPDERVLVFTDTITPEEQLARAERARRTGLVAIARASAEIGRQHAKDIVYIEYPSLGGPAMEPPVNVWQAAFGKKAVSVLKGKKLLGPILKKTVSQTQIEEAMAVAAANADGAVDAVIALANYSTTHTTFRKLLTAGAGARYASMPLFDASMLDGPLAADYKELKKISAALKRALSGKDVIRITTPNGTDISFRRGGRKINDDTGDLRKPGATSNLPAGEVYLAPLEGTANGVLVLEWSATRKLKYPVTLIVEGGNVVQIEGREPFVKELAQKLAAAPECANIAELGIGTNAKAKRPDNILESEKILGTIHIALGDNHTFGGKVSAPFHQDFVFFKPTLTAASKDGAKTVIMKKGKLLP
ncbi:MAG: aminopeptidase [Actinomycetota bacterium]|nr:aminopeptidase [Actinomycetota bacterium]